MIKFKLNLPYIQQFKVFFVLVQGPEELSKTMKKESLTDSGGISSDCQDTQEERAFDFKKFCTHLRSSILQTSNDFTDIDLHSYLTAYEQLQNFFVLLGTAFQFVALDVKSKIKILQSYQKNGSTSSISTASNYFSTVQSMVEYEKKSDLLTNSKYVSGSRTLLRLHRGLDFVRKFLSELYQLNNEAKLGTVARDVYNQTLAEHHSWVVKNTARVAMQFLPTRIELLRKISEFDDEKMNQMLELFPDAIEAMNIVYDSVQHIYTVNDLLDLP